MMTNTALIYNFPPFTLKENWNMMSEQGGHFVLFIL